MSLREEYIVIFGMGLKFAWWIKTFVWYVVAMKQLICWVTLKEICCIGIVIYIVWFSDQVVFFIEVEREVIVEKVIKAIIFDRSMYGRVEEKY